MRSGLDEAVVPVCVLALEGLVEEEEGGAPKKSKPKSESPCFCCFGGADAFGGGARTLGVSVVLGRAGGVGTSPKRSTVGAGVGFGSADWPEADAAR